MRNFVETHITLKRSLAGLAILATLNATWIGADYWQLLPKSEPVASPQAQFVAVENVSKNSKINPKAPGCVITDKDGARMTFEPDPKGEIHIPRGVSLSTACVID